MRYGLPKVPIPRPTSRFFAPGRAPFSVVAILYAQSAWLIVSVVPSLIRAAWRRAIRREVPPVPPPPSNGTGTKGDAGRAASLLAASPCYSPSDLLGPSPLDRRMLHARRLPAPARLARTNLGEDEARGVGRRPRNRAAQVGGKSVGVFMTRRESFRSPCSDPCRFPRERRD